MVWRQRHEIEPVRHVMVVERIAGAPKHQRLETEPAKPMERQILPMGGGTDSNRLVQMITP